MPETLVTVAYLTAGLLFILSLGGLSAQASARRGNTDGIIGMIIAIGATAFGPWHPNSTRPRSPAPDGMSRHASISMSAPFGTCSC